MTQPSKNGKKKDEKGYAGLQTGRQQKSVHRVEYSIHGVQSGSGFLHATQCCTVFD